MPPPDLIAKCMGAASTSAQLCRSIESIDPMFIDGCLLLDLDRAALQEIECPLSEIETLVDGRNEFQLRWVNFKIVYTAFQAPGPLWPRDISICNLTMHYHCEASAEDIVICCAGSIPQDLVPEVPKRCRAEVHTSGYLFRVRRGEEPRAPLPGSGLDHPVRVMYTCCVDPAGIIPNSIKNLVAVEQALTAFRVSRRLAEVYRSQRQLALPLPNEGMRFSGRTAMRAYVQVPPGASMLRLSCTTTATLRVKIASIGSTDQGAAEALMQEHGSMARLLKASSQHAQRITVLADEVFTHSPTAATTTDLGGKIHTTEFAVDEEGTIVCIELAPLAGGFLGNTISYAYLRVDHAGSGQSWTLMDNDRIGYSAEVAVDNQVAQNWEARERNQKSEVDLASVQRPPHEKYHARTATTFPRLAVLMYGVFAVSTSTFIKEGCALERNMPDVELLLHISKATQALVYAFFSLVQAVRCWFGLARVWWQVAISLFIAGFAFCSSIQIALFMHFTGNSTSALWSGVMACVSALVAAAEVGTNGL